MHKDKAIRWLYGFIFMHFSRDSQVGMTWRFHSTASDARTTQTDQTVEGQKAYYRPLPIFLPYSFFCLSLLTTSTSAFFTLLGVEMWPAWVYPTSDSKNEWIATRSHCTPWIWQLLDTGYEYFARRRGKVINLKRTFPHYILVRELNIPAEWLARIQAQMFLLLL